MFGPHWDDNSGYQNTMSPMPGSSYKMQQSGTDPFLSDQQKYGIIPRSIEGLFHGLQQIQAGNPGKGYTVYCSFLQIYNEKLYDLF
jgi:hypothetical protein